MRVMKVCEPVNTRLRYRVANDSAQRARAAA